LTPYTEVDTQLNAQHNAHRYTQLYTFANFRAFDPWNIALEIDEKLD